MRLPPLRVLRAPTSYPITPPARRVSRAPAVGDRDETRVRAALYGEHTRTGDVTPLGAGLTLEDLLAPPAGLEASALSWLDRLEGPWR